MHAIAHPAPVRSHTPHRLLAVLAAAAVCLSGGAVASAAASGGKLTSLEYARIQQAMTNLKKALSGSPANWTAARQACTGIGSATPLLASQANICLTNVVLLGALAQAPAKLKTCNQPLPQRIYCMVPFYDGYAHDITAAYHSATAAERVAVARGFGGQCLYVLVATPAQLAQTQQLMAVTDRLASDVAGLAADYKHARQPSKASLQQMLGDATAFNTAANAWLTARGPDNLALCPHG